MIIEKLEINNFGQLHKEEIVLHRGMNVLYGENERGKSTIHAFIRAMFFGMERSRGKGARTDLYSRYQPWENPTSYGGAMEFSCDGKRFRLERNFYSETKSAVLVCLDDGEHLDVEHGDLDMLLGGINPVIYDNTVSVGQLKSITGKELAEELKSYIANYQGGGDGDINPNEALELLKGKKRSLQQTKRDYQEECRDRMRQVEGKLQLLEAEQKECRRKIQREEETQKQYIPQQQKQKPQNISSSTDKVGALWRKITIVWAVLAMVALALAVVFHGKTTSVIFLVMAGAAGIQILVSQLIRGWLVRKLRNAQTSSETTEITETQDDTVRESAGKLVQLREDYQERQVRMENLQQEYEEARESCYERIQEDEELEAVELAMETLQRSTILMENHIGSRLRLRMGEILSEITEGRYTNVLLEENMEIRLQTIQRQIQLHQLSRGTLEQVYFALRMAAGEVLCGQESMPVILDEVFAMYDDTRLDRALDWLKEHREQTILFTCQKRELRQKDVM